MKKYLIIPVLIVFFITPGWTDPLNLLIKNLEEYEKKPEKISFDFYSDQFNRPDSKQIKINNYKNQNLNLENLFQKALVSMYEEHDEQSDHQYKKANPLAPAILLKHFNQLKEKGDNLHTGDILLIQPTEYNSYLIARNSDSQYSHGAFIWIKNDQAFVADISAQTDFALIPLIDYLLPKTPKNAAIGIFRYKKPFNQDKMTQIFQIFEEQKNKICFDYLFITNPSIQNPDTYLDKYPFIFCYEFIKLTYEYASGNNDFLSPYRINSSKVAANIGYNPLLTVLVSAFSELNSNSKQFVLSSNNFTESTDFYPVLEIIPASSDSRNPSASKSQAQ